jgi:hypothetical protein
MKQRWYDDEITMMRWHDGENNILFSSSCHRSFIIAPSYFCLRNIVFFIIVSSRFHHRTFIVSPSYHRCFNIVQSLCNARTIVFSVFHYRTKTVPSRIHHCTIVNGMLHVKNDKCAFLSLKNMRQMYSLVPKKTWSEYICHTIGLFMGRHLRSHLSHVGQMRPHLSYMYVRQVYSEKKCAPTMLWSFEYTASIVLINDRLLYYYALWTINNSQCGEKSMEARF